MQPLDMIIREFVDNDILTEDIAEQLNEDNKMDSVREAANQVLQGIISGLGAIDTSVIDKSRGNISLLRDLIDIQNVINMLMETIETSPVAVDGRIGELVEDVIQLLRNLSGNSKVFQDAYREKKTILILKYQSLVASLYASVSYLFNVVAECTPGGVFVRKRIKFDPNISYLTNIKSFNDMVASGVFKQANQQVMRLREFYNENSLDTMRTITEAQDVVSVVINGLSNIIRDGDITSKIKKGLSMAMGIMYLLFSSREVFFTLFRSKFKISDMIENVRGISNIANLNSVNKLVNFGSRFPLVAEETTKMAKMDIVDQDRAISQNIKQIPDSVTLLNEPKVEYMPTKAAAPAVDGFDFGF